MLFKSYFQEDLHKGHFVFQTESERTQKEMGQRSPWTNSNGAVAGVKLPNQLPF